MLRVDKRAGFAQEGAWLWRRHRFAAGPVVAAQPVGRRLLAELAVVQLEEPIAVLEHEGRRWWWFRDRFYWEDDELSARDVLALLVERERRKRRRLDRAHAALHRELDGAARRPPIPRDLRFAVWQRDGGRCVDCGSDFELQFDHVIPFSMGGATSAENLQLLCGSCNREKGAGL
jgi:hypothetical protein